MRHQPLDLLPWKRCILVSDSGTCHSRKDIHAQVVLAHKTSQQEYKERCLNILIVVQTIDFAILTMMANSGRD
jgi:hypothetical protein